MPFKTPTAKAGPAPTASCSRRSWTSTTGAAHAESHDGSTGILARHTIPYVNPAEAASAQVRVDQPGFLTGDSSNQTLRTCLLSQPWLHAILRSWKRPSYIKGFGAELLDPDVSLSGKSDRNGQKAKPRQGFGEGTTGSRFSRLHHSCLPDGLPRLRVHGIRPSRQRENSAPPKRRADPSRANG